MLFINVELYIPFLILLIWPLPELFSNKRLSILTAPLIKLEERLLSLIITLFISPLVLIKDFALHFSKVQLSIFTVKSPEPPSIKPAYFLLYKLVNMIFLRLTFNVLPKLNA